MSLTAMPLSAYETIEWNTTSNRTPVHTISISTTLHTVPDGNGINMNYIIYYSFIIKYFPKKYNEKIRQKNKEIT